MDFDFQKEMIAISEQGFYESHFEYGNDEDTLKQNYFLGIDLFIEKYYHAQELSEKVVYGEIVDTPLLNQAVQELVFSYRFAKRFREELTEEPLINPSELSLSLDDVDKVILGNKYMGQYALSHDYDEYEMGKWYLYGLQ